MVIGQKELTVVHTEVFFHSTALLLHVITHQTDVFVRCTPAFCSISRMTWHSKNTALKLKVQFLALFFIYNKTSDM